MEKTMIYWTRALLVAICLMCTSTHAVGQKPNIVFILADDLGWTDIGCQGSKYYETPNIDKLAAQGMRFTSYYHCQNCAPTRAALMSGQYPPRTGIYTVGTLERGNADARKMNVPANVTQLPLDRMTMADVNESGRLRDRPVRQMAPRPDGRLITRRSAASTRPSSSMGKHFDFATQPKVDYPKGDLPRRLAHRQGRRSSSTRTRTSRSSCACTHFGVHVAARGQEGADREVSRRRKASAGTTIPIYAAMIDSVDESVGRIVAKLDELKLADNTLVIFASDNGGVGGYDREGIERRRRHGQRSAARRQGHRSTKAACACRSSSAGRARSSSRARPATRRPTTSICSRPSSNIGGRQAAEATARRREPRASAEGSDGETETRRHLLHTSPAISKAAARAMAHDAGRRSFAAATGSCSSSSRPASSSCTT